MAPPERVKAVLFGWGSANWLGVGVAIFMTC